MDPNPKEITDEEEEAPALRMPKLAARGQPTQKAWAKRALTAIGYTVEYMRRLANMILGFCNEGEYEQCFPNHHSRTYYQII